MKGSRAPECATGEVHRLLENLSRPRLGGSRLLLRKAARRFYASSEIVVLDRAAVVLLWAQPPGRAGLAARGAKVLGHMGHHPSRLWPP
eukprot:5618348-Alexandrium_andersonii.AAC.1